MIDDERAELLSQITALQERLASYIVVVDDVVERLGHEGSEPEDLQDAIGEIEGMLAGKITNEPHDLTGLAELVRQALWHRDRARLLLADARNTCEQRAAERDAAILERDAAARELARVLAAQTAVTRKFAETDLWLECTDEAPLPRTPDGYINNCALRCIGDASQCQMCTGECPDAPLLKGPL